MPGPLIRNAAAPDLDRLVRLEEQAFESDRMSARSYRRLLTSPTAACRVAMVGGSLAGSYTLLFRRNGAVARLYSIAVADAHRGKGIGAALLGDAERSAVGRRCRVLRLEVREQNGPAIALYERRGYRRVGRRPLYYSDGSAAIVYEKSLDLGAAEDRSPRDLRRASLYIRPAKTREQTPTARPPDRPRKAGTAKPPAAEPPPLPT